MFTIFNIRYSEGVGRVNNSALFLAVERNGYKSTAVIGCFNLNKAFFNVNRDFVGNSPGDLDLSYGTMRTLVVLARALEEENK